MARATNILERGVPKVLMVASPYKYNMPKHGWKRSRLFDAVVEKFSKYNLAIDKDKLELVSTYDGDTGERYNY